MTPEQQAELQERKISEACTRKRWRTVAVGIASFSQEGWFKGVRVLRHWHYGTLSNPHAPSRWRITGYEARGIPFDTFGAALEKALER